MIDQKEIFAQLNEGILAERSYIFKKNLKKNLPLIMKNGGLSSVVQSLKGKHMLVIGSGPTLDDSIEILKKLRSKKDIIFIAADMALKPLYGCGISPHYVITCETTPVDFFSGIDTGKMHLLAFSCSSHSNIRRWNGGMSFFNWMVDGDLYDELWKEAGEGLGFVASGGIVTTQAVSLVLGCNVSSLLLVGNDMGFFDRFYASGTSQSEKKFFISGRLNPHTSIDMNRGRMARDYQVKRGGELFYTNNQFLAARLWLENLFKSAPYPVAECGKPGCSAGVIQKIDLAGYLDIFENRTNGGI